MDVVGWLDVIGIGGGVVVWSDHSPSVWARCFGLFVLWRGRAGAAADGSVGMMKMGGRVVIWFDGMCRAVSALRKKVLAQGPRWLHVRCVWWRSSIDVAAGDVLPPSPSLSIAIGVARVRGGVARLGLSVAVQSHGPGTRRGLSDWVCR